MATRYFPDPENTAEKARLIQQGRLLTNRMGGLLAEQSHPKNFRDVLDAACGPGEWAVDLAFSYPTIKVVGIDISEPMIRFAREKASTQGLENVNFSVMDATVLPLQFPQASFDLVNARTIAGFMPRTIWPLFIGECMRILRPGGVIRITECDSWGITNSPAFEQLHNLCMLASKQSELGFSPDGRTFGITCVLSRLLREAGFRAIRERSFTNNFSRGEEGAQAMFSNFMAFFELALPKLVQLGMGTQAYLSRLNEEALAEMQAESFCGNSFFLTVWATKPDEPSVNLRREQG